jgi:hypothetical protein
LKLDSVKVSVCGKFILNVGNIEREDNLIKIGVSQNHFEILLKHVIRESL